MKDRNKPYLLDIDLITGLDTSKFGIMADIRGNDTWGMQIERDSYNYELCEEHIRNTEDTLAYIAHDWLRCGLIDKMFRRSVV